MPSDCLLLAPFRRGDSEGVNVSKGCQAKSFSLALSFEICHTKSRERRDVAFCLTWRPDSDEQCWGLTSAGSLVQTRKGLELERTGYLSKMYGTRTDWPTTNLLSSHSFALLPSLYACLASYSQPLQNTQTMVQDI